MATNNHHRGQAQAAVKPAHERLAFEVRHNGKLLGEARFSLDRINIGTAAEADLRIKDPYVSTNHCIVEIKNDQVFLQDQGSKNGTIMNGRKVQLVELLDGDAIQVGRCEVVVHFLNGLRPTAEKRHQTAVEADNEKTAIDIDASKLTKPAPVFHKKEEQEQPTQLLIDPGFDEDEDDEYERNFTPSFSLVKSLINSTKTETGIRKSDRVLEVLEFMGDTVLNNTVIESGSFTIRTLGEKRKLLQVERGSFKLSFSGSDEGFVVLAGKKIEFADLVHHNQVNVRRDGMGVMTLGIEDQVCIRIGEKKYFVRYSEKQQAPRARLKLPLSREMGKMIGFSCLTHVLAIIVITFISARGNAAIDKSLEEERFVKIDVADLKEKPPEPPKVAEAPKPTPVPTPAPKPIVKPTPKPEPKPKIVKAEPIKKPMVKLPEPVKPKPVQQISFAEKPKAKPLGSPNPVPQAPSIEKAGVLGALAGIGSPFKQQKLVSSLTNLHAVQAKGGAQTFSVSGLQGKIDSDDVVIQRIGDVKTKGASGVGQRNYGVAMVTNKKGDLGGVSGLVMGSDDVIRPTIKGGLSREEIAKVVKQHVAEINYCYEKGLLDDPSLAGKMNVLWNINGEGRVTLTRIQASELRNGKVHSCISNNIRTWQFPKPSGAALVEVTYPFIFSNSGY